MQYILTEEEMKRGYQLIEAWRVKIAFEQMTDKLESLHSQGFFTVVNDDYNDVDGLSEIIVYNKV